MTAPSAGASSRPPDINASCSRAQRARGEVEVVAVGSRDARRARGASRAEHGIPARYGSYEELLADPSVEASTSRCRTRCTASGRSRRSRRASTCSARSRCRASAAEVEAAFDAAERDGLPADRRRSCGATTRRRERLARLVRDGAIGELRRDPRGVQLRALRRRTNIRLRTDARRRLADGRRLLLRQRLAPARRRARARSSGAQLRRPDGRRLGASRARCASRATCSRVRLRDGRAERDELEAIGSRGLAPPRRPLALRERRSSSCGGRRLERIEVEPATPYQLELEDLGRAIRGDAAAAARPRRRRAQARVIAALRRSAADGRDTAPA